MVVPIPQAVVTLNDPPLNVHPDWQVLFMAVIKGACIVYEKILDDCPQMITTTSPVHGMPAGTVATMDVCDWDVKAVTAIPPMITVLPDEPKLVPVIVMVLPEVSTDGLMPLMTGAGKV